MSALCPALQVLGSGFVNRTGLILCRFGEQWDVEGSYASPNVVRCHAPGRADPGYVPVAVSTDGGRSFGCSGPASVLLRYLSPCSVSSVLPRSGPDVGGTSISVLGSGFSRAMAFTCTFGSASDASAPVSPAVWVSPSQLSCISPPARSRYQIRVAIPVTVSVDLGEGLTTLAVSSPGASMSFIYVPSVQLHMIFPAHGPIAGGTIVEISGANFDPAGAARGIAGSALEAERGEPTADSVWCSFGTAVSIGSLISDSVIRCSSPPKGLQGSYVAEIGVSINGGADFMGGGAGPLVRQQQRLCQPIIHLVSHHGC